MRKKITFLLIMSCLFYMNGYAQTPFWSDTFEDSGAPSSGVRNAPTAFTTSTDRLFNRTNAAGVTTVSGPYLLGEGTKFWAGEDTDNGLTPITVANVLKTVTWSINISGKSNIKLKGLFASGNIGNNAFENGTASSSGVNDYMSMQYSIDGGPIQNLLSFYPLANAASDLYPDTNFDGNGDTGSTALGTTFTEFIGNVTGTGTTLTLYMNMSMTGNAEEVAIDNLRLVEIAPCVPPVVTVNPLNKSVCSGNNTTFGITATGATGYQWQENSGSGFTNLANGGVYSGVTTNTLTITGVTAGMSGYLYRCIAYNPTIACFTNSNPATLTVSSISTATGSQTNVSCFGGTNGTATVTPSGGIAPYSYSWSPSGGTAATASGLGAGTYTVTVTDNIACQATRVYTITQPPAAVSGTTVVTNVACFGNNTGAINLTPTGGTPPYTFNWGGGITSEDRTGLAAGSYSVTITDANGCTGTVNPTVTQPAAVVSGTTVVTNVACFGGNNGAINLTPTGGVGPYTFNWVGGATTEDRTSLTAGTYSVTITDANGCTGTVAGITVTQPTAAVSGTTVVTNVACNGGNTGAINLTPTGGTGPYTFNWGGGITTEDRTTLAAGTYSVTITDVNGCTGTVAGITVTQPLAISGTTVVTNVACFGNNTGAINLTPTGGTAPYVFNWGGGITTEDRTGLASGTYSVTITDVNGCTGTVAGITVTQPAAAVSGTTVVTNVACFGGNNGAINLTPTGGVGPYTFNWVGGATTEDRVLLTAGTYSVTITDANGCTGTVAGITVTQPTAAVSGTTVITNVACFGGNNGAINLTPTGGTGPYTFNWGGGITTEDRTGLANGSYSVTITDANGCTGTVSPIIVTQPSFAVNGTTIVTNIACNGATTGSINLTPTGGTGPYTFNWGGGITTEDRTGLAAGTYSVTITDSNGCTGTIAGISVTQPASALGGTTVVTNVACFGNNTGAINLTPTGGTGPYTFNWGGGITTEDRTGLASGTYSVTITDNNGCTATVAGITVTQPAAAVSGTTVVTNVTCNGGNTGAINLTPTGGVGPYTFNWGGGITTEDRTGLIAGSYSVTITDANGCTGTVAGITITAPTVIDTATGSQTNVSCFGVANGSATVTPTGGTPGYTYSWAPTGGTNATATGLAAGIYIVTVTDANGCQATRLYTITEPAAALLATPVSQTNIACNGNATGSATVSASGGTPGYTYSWAPAGGTAATASGLTAGIYTVTVTDANGCTDTESFTITEPTALVATPVAQTNVTCNGADTGSATVSASGGTAGYTYSWAPAGGTAATASGLAAGIYTVTVTDANGCTDTESFTITEPTALVATPVAQTNVACNGADTGSATVSASGGTAGYTYSWAPAGGTAATASGLAAGTYTVTVTDANGCTDTESFTITEPTALVATPVAQTNVACNGADTGSATVSASGGTAGYTYSWAPAGGTAATASGLAAGTYTVTVTDANGCTDTESFTITEPNAITVTPTQTNATCNGDSNGSATVSVSGGTPGYTYSWAPAGGTAATATGLAAGTYTVTITDANGCTKNENFTITEPTALDPSVTLVGNTLTANQAGATYQWFECPSTPIVGATNQTFSPSTSGSYGVTITLGACSVTSGCTLGNEEFEANQSFMLYPNPSKDIVNIKSSFDGDFVVVNQLGQTVRTFKVTANNINTINLDSLAEGVYFIRGANQTKIKTQRLVIKK